MTKPFWKLPGKEHEKLFQEAAQKERKESFDKGWCCAEGGFNDSVAFAFPPDGTVKIDKKDIREAIEYAIRSNETEGLDTSKSTEELLNQVHFGKITLEQVRQLIDQKAKALAKDKEIESILASLRMEGLEPNKETLSMVEMVKCGEITTTEAIEAGKIKFTALREGKHITLNDALKIVKSPRQGWTEKFKEMHEAGDDELIDKA